MEVKDLKTAKEFVYAWRNDWKHDKSLRKSSPIYLNKKFTTFAKDLRACAGLCKLKDPVRAENFIQASIYLEQAAQEEYSISEAV